MMRILLVGPTGVGGSLPPYLNVLTEALRLHGAQVDRLGTPAVPFDQHTSAFWPAGRIVATAENLLEDVDLTAYDILSVHFGNLEVEQLLPTLWRDRKRPPAVYHVHCLDWTLFTTHVPDAALRTAVDEGIAGMDGYVFFGAYARSELGKRIPSNAATTVSWLPTTIPSGTQPDARPALRAALCCDEGPVGSLYGYAAPWKDTAGLIDACEKVTTSCRVLLAGPFWNNLHQAGVGLCSETSGGVRHGAVHVEVIPSYLGPPERKALVLGTHFAVFPYKHQPTFQGSGAIADYLAHGVPVLGTDIANMAELVGDAGLITEPGDHQALTDGLERLASDERYRDRLSRNARRRSRQFSAANHAARCLRLYQAVIDQNPPVRG